MSVNNKITLSELALLIDISQRGVEKNVKLLRALGVISRVGPAKGGHWEVLL